IWTGSFQELLDALTLRISDPQKKSKAWPATARGLSAILKRLAPCLRQVGITVEVGARGKSGRPVSIRYEARGEEGGEDIHHVHHVHPTGNCQTNGVTVGVNVDRQGDGRADTVTRTYTHQTLGKSSPVTVGERGVRCPGPSSPDTDTSNNGDNCPW